MSILLGDPSKKEDFGPKYILVTDWLPKTQVSGFGSAGENWVLPKFNKIFFFIFCQIFGIFDDFSILWSELKVLLLSLKNHKIHAKNLAKNEKK